MKSKLFLIILIALSAFACGKYVSTESSQGNNSDVSGNQLPSSESMSINIVINKGSKIKADFLTNGKSEYSVELDSENQLPEFYAKFKNRMAANDDAIIVLKTDFDITITQLNEFRKQAKDSGAKELYLRQNDQTEISRFNLKEEEDSTNIYPPRDGKPNPFTLVIDLDEKGNLMLNNDKLGTIDDTSQLENRLNEVFKARKDNKVFREGTNETETGIFIRIPKDTKFNDPNTTKLYEAVKKSGASPIGLAFR